MALFGKIPTIVNLTLTTANTEYSQLIPTGTKKYTVQCRTDKELKLAYTEGESGSNFITIPEGVSLYEDKVNTPPGLTLYLQSPTAAVVAEIVFWVTE